MVVVASFVSLSAGIHGFAQDALRSAIEGDRSYQNRSGVEFIPDRDAIRTGPVTYAFSLGYSLEWNDNVRSTQEDTDSDFIHRPNANVRATWQATRDSVISMGMGFGYQFYTENTDLNRAFFTPDSDLAWDIPVKDWVFTVYDRFSYSQDLLSQPAFVGTGQTGDYPRMDNTAGLRARWMPSRYVFEAGYGHNTFYTDSQDYSYLNRSSEQFFGRAGYRFAEATQAGVEVSSGLTSYKDSSRGDNQNISVGPYAQWQVTEATYIALHGGYVIYHYDPDTFVATNGATFATEARDHSSWYAGVEVRNRLTDDISHGLTFSREVQQGANQIPGANVNTDYVELLSAGYSISWAFHHKGSLGANVTYEHGTEPYVIREEVFDRYGFGINASWRFTRHFSTGLGYRFSTRSSNLDDRDYQVNSVTLSASYIF